MRFLTVALIGSLQWTLICFPSTTKEGELRIILSFFLILDSELRIILSFFVLLFS